MNPFGLLEPCSIQEKSSKCAQWHALLDIRDIIELDCGNPALLRFIISWYIYLSLAIFFVDARCRRSHSLSVFAAFLLKKVNFLCIVTVFTQWHCSWQTCTWCFDLAICLWPGAHNQKSGWLQKTVSLEIFTSKHFEFELSQLSHTTRPFPARWSLADEYWK